MAALYQTGNVLFRGITAFIPISSFKIQIRKCRIAFPGGCLTVQQGCKWRATFLNHPEHPEHASCSSIFYSDIQITALQKPRCFNTSSSPVGKATHTIFQQTAGPDISKKANKRHSSLSGCADNANYQVCHNYGIASLYNPNFSFFIVFFLLVLDHISPRMNATCSARQKLVPCEDLGLWC